MVRTGDQAVERVSRHIAPCHTISNHYPPPPASAAAPGALGQGLAYRLTADIGVPDFGLELHDWRPERVFRGYFDVNFIGSTLVGSTWGSSEGSPQVGEVVPTSHRFSCNLRVGIRMDICDLLCNTARTVRSHGDK